MGSLAINGRTRTQQCVSNSGIEKKDDQTGALAEAKESPVPRAQFLSPITSCFKAIGNRICKALDNAVNAVNRARGAWALNSINSGYATPEKIVSEIKFLRELIGNDDEKLDGAIKWGSSEVSKPECTLARRIFERNAAAALFFNLEDKKVASLVTKENDKELKDFHKNLCQKADAHYRWVCSLVK